MKAEVFCCSERVTADVGLDVGLRIDVKQGDLA